MLPLHVRGLSQTRPVEQHGSPLAPQFWQRAGAPMQVVRPVHVAAAQHGSLSSPQLRQVVVASHTIVAVSQVVPPQHG